MTLVCLDTKIVIQGLLKQISDPSQQSIVNRSALLIKLIEKNGDSVILPTVVVGEVLVKIPQEERGEVVKRLRENWIIVDYDVRAAMKFGEIRSRMKIIRDQEREREGKPSTARCVLSPDAMIAATAIVNGAEIIYTGDKNFVKLAQGYIGMRYLDDLHLPGEQHELWN